MNNLVKQILAMVAGGLIVIGALHVSGVSAQRQDSVTDTVAPAEADATLVSYEPVFQYQGQLLSPTTGQPVADGTYPITFRLYQELNGTQESFWGQLMSVPVTSGIFSVVLGGTAGSPIPYSAFDGRQLYLGVQVGSDPEMTPRQPIYPIPYAMNARFFNGLTTSDFVPIRRGPVAYGIVNSNCSRERGFRFSSTRSVVGGQPRTGECVITVRDANDNPINYNLNEFTTVVSVVESSECQGGSFATTGSGNGNLYIDVYQANGSQRDCKFHFITFQP